jgi:hypothetical protein
MKITTRVLIGALCGAVLVVVGISQFRHGETPAAKPIQSAHPAQPKDSHPPAILETTPTETPDAREQSSGPIDPESPGLPAISAFRQWADAGAASGFSQSHQIKGMELAKARAAAMKLLIQQDPVEALRQALPADVRNSLPPQIAAAIEQPVQKSGMCAMRLACNHSHDGPHEECHSIPILTGGADTWNAYYGDPQWETLVGQPVEFEGVSVEGELAVRKIDAAPLPTDP